MSSRLCQARRRRPMPSLALAFGWLLLCLALPAPAARAGEIGGIRISGFFNLYAAAARHPPAGERNFAGLGTVATREGELALDFAGLELRREPAPWGFTLILGAGDELEAIHSAEEKSARDSFRNIFQASVAYQKNALRFEAGIFPSHIGFEGTLPQNNWNYSHSWTATLSPFYQTGLKLVYTPDDTTVIELHALNGWQQIADLNRGRSVGLKLARRWGALTSTLNAIYGDEPVPGGNRPRSLYDLILEARLAPTLSATLETYRGRQERVGLAAADWQAVALWLRWQQGKNALSLRGEHFDDADGGISGRAQRLDSLTFTWDHELAGAARLRCELRRDCSSAELFPSRSPRRQELAIVALGFSF